MIKIQEYKVEFIDHYKVKLNGFTKQETTFKKEKDKDITPIVSYIWQWWRDAGWAWNRLKKELAAAN